MSDKELDIVEQEEVLEGTPHEDVDASEIEEATASKGEPKITETAAMPKTKAGMIQAMVDAMNGKKKDELTASYDKIMSSMNNDDMEDEAEEVTPSKVKKESRKVTREEVDLEKDIEALFGSEDLSEDFKNKATTIFEAAVLSKINETLDKLEAQATADEAAIKESTIEEMTNKLDEYLDYVVHNFMEENKLAVEHGVRVQMVESFMTGLKGLFEEHYVDIPEEKVDVVDELIAKVDDLENKVNGLTEENIDLRSTAKQLERNKVFEQVGKDLTEAQKEEFEALADGVEFKSSEDFEEKLGIIKDNYFAESKDNAGEVISDDDDVPTGLQEIKEETTGPMANYLSAISRSVRN